MDFQPNEMIGKVNAEHSVTAKDIKNIICGSFEGGSGYWMDVDVNRPEWKGKPNTTSLSMWATHMLLDGKGFYVKSKEESARNWGKIMLEDIIRGIHLNYKNRDWDSNIQEGDVITADCIIQYARYGDVVYG